MKKKKIEKGKCIMQLLLKSPSLAFSSAFYSLSLCLSPSVFLYLCFCLHLSVSVSLCPLCTRDGSQSLLRDICLWVTPPPFWLILLVLVLSFTTPSAWHTESAHLTGAPLPHLRIQWGAQEPLVQMGQSLAKASSSHRNTLPCTWGPWQYSLPCRGSKVKKCSDCVTAYKYFRR